jgi:hypothetical protein
MYLVKTLTILNYSYNTRNIVKFEDIKLAKKYYYNKVITNSKNKSKTTWGINRYVTNAKTSNI